MHRKNSNASSAFGKQRHRYSKSSDLECTQLEHMRMQKVAVPSTSSVSFFSIKVKDYPGSPSSKKYKTSHFQLASASDKHFDRESAEQQDKDMLRKLYDKLVAYKERNTRTITTHQQKERYLRRFSKTIGDGRFKATGFDLDHHCLGFVFDYIREDGRIRKIVLDGNHLGNQGIARLAELVRGADIEELSLVSVGIDSKGAALLFRTMKGKSSIKKVNISSNEGPSKNRIAGQGA